MRTSPRSWTALLTTASLIAAPGAIPVRAPLRGSERAWSRSAPHATEGSSTATDAVADAMLRLDDKLRGLLAGAPEAAKSEVERALRAMQKGRETALAALRSRDENEPRHAAEMSTARARFALETSRRVAENALKGAYSGTESASRVSLRVALNQVRLGTRDALVALDDAVPDPTANAPRAPSATSSGGAGSGLTRR